MFCEKLIRFLLLLLTITECLFFIRLYNSTISPFIDGTVEENKKDVVDLSKLTVKELKSLATALQDGRSVTKKFFDKQELVEYVEVLRKKSVKLSCGTFDINSASSITKLHSQFSLVRFLKAKSLESTVPKIAVIFLYNTGPKSADIDEHYFNVHLPKLSRELSKTFCGIIKFASVSAFCTKEDYVSKEICAYFQFHSDNPIGIAVKLPTSKTLTHMEDYSQSTKVEEIEKWLKHSFLYDFNTSLPNCPITAKLVKTLYHDCHHNILCTNGDILFQTNYSSSQYKLRSKLVTYENLLHFVCPSFSVFCGVIKSYLMFCGILFCTWIGYETSVKTQAHTSFVVLSFIYVVTSSTSVLYGTLVNTIAHYLCSVTLWKLFVDWTLFFNGIDGFELFFDRLILLKLFKSGFIFWVFVGMFVLVQNRFVAASFKLQERERSLAVIISKTCSAITSSFLLLVKMICSAILNNGNPARDNPHSDNPHSDNPHPDNPHLDNPRPNVQQPPNRRRRRRRPVNRRRQNEPEVQNDEYSFELNAQQRAFRAYYIWQIMQMIENEAAANAAQQALQITFSYERPEQGENEICTICRCDLEDLDSVYEIRCNHFFHADCLHTWVFDHRQFTCPNCRYCID